MSAKPNSVMDLHDRGLSAQQIADATGSTLDRVQKQLSYMGARGGDQRADAHFRNIADGSRKLLKRIIEVHGAPRTSPFYQPPAKEMAK